ncbi:MAG: hypothetical protein ACTSUE_10400 [Promethearchaeota archaeon]
MKKLNFKLKIEVYLTGIQIGTIQFIPTHQRMLMKYHKRLICCKIRGAGPLQEAITLLKQIRFKDITRVEFFGKRGSKIMLERDSGDQVHRLHLRVYTINETNYFLIHEEPRPNPNIKDISFHVKGFFSRIGKNLKEFIKYKQDGSPDKVTIKNDERDELSDYESGCTRFKKIVSAEAPELDKILDFHLDEMDYTSFSLTFGSVSKVLPAEMLLSNLKNKQEGGNLPALCSDVMAALDFLGFKGMKRVPFTTEGGERVSPAEGSSFIDSVVDVQSYSSDALQYTFYAIILRDARGLGSYVDFIHSLAGGTRAFILLLYDGDAPALDERVIRGLRKKRVQLSSMRIVDFIYLFEKFLAFPFSKERILEMMGDHPFFKKESIDSIQPVKYRSETLANIMLDLLEFLASNPGWHKVSEVERVMVSRHTFLLENRNVLRYILDLLVNPIFFLIETKRKGKFIKGIENKDELKMKISKVKKILIDLGRY